MRTWAVLAGVLCLLAACERPAAQSSADQAAKVNLLKPPAAVTPSDTDASSAAAARSSTPAAPNPAASPMLAYSYDYGVEAPAAKVRALMATHQAACDAAGPSVCQVTGAEGLRGRQGPGQRQAHLPRHPGLAEGL